MLKWFWQRLTGADTKLPLPVKNQYSAQSKPSQPTDRQVIVAPQPIEPRSPHKPESAPLSRVLEQPLRSCSEVVPISSRAKMTATASSKQITCWIPAGQSITVAEYTVSGGMVYVGSQLAPARGNGGTDPCLIDPKLKVDRSSPDYSGSSMSYWPSYSDISASCRAAYLDWLSNGRSDPNAYIGYLFLFLYGLERRVFVDLKRFSADSFQELGLIVAEVERLLALHKGSGSFNGYATNFLEVCRLLQNHEKLYDASPPLTRTGWEIPLKIRITLGRLVAEGKPIPADWAMSWYIHSPQARLRTPATRCVEEFQQLFRSRYQQQYGEGLVIKPNKTRLKCSYHPASAAFAGSVEIDIGDLPDITTLSAPFNRLQTLVDDCTDSLESYSRWIGRNPGAVESHTAVALLPVELSSSRGCESLQVFRQWLVARLMKRSTAIISAKDLLQRWAGKDCSRLHKGELTRLSNFLEKEGYGIEPDSRFGGKTLTSEGSVVLFKLPLQATKTLSHEYSVAALLLHLAAAVASADGTVEASEQAYLESYLETALSLSEPERIRLRAHLTWLLQEKLSLRGLKPRLNAIAPEKRMMIAQFLVSVAGADGQISPKEVSTLAKLYLLLELDPQDVYSHIHQLSTVQTPATSATEPVTVRPASSRQKGFAIPAPLDETKNTQDEKQAPGFVLDMKLIEAKRTESAAVAAILGDIFAEDEPLLSTSPTATVAETFIAGLDAPHSELVRQLRKRSCWSRDGLEQVVAQLGLMIDGALETINEAAFDQCEEPLTEGDELIEVNAEVLEELLS